MTTPPQSKRWQEITAIWQDNRWLYVIAGVLIGILITPTIQEITEDLYALLGNFVPEAVGIIFTVLILNKAADNRAIQERKLALFRQVKSRSNDAALEALDQIQYEGWWDDLLEHYKDYEGIVDLTAIQWANIKLPRINLQDVNLQEANLQNANLQNANLASAYFGEAKLQNIDLYEANLKGVDFTYANLQSADLSGANLDNVSLDASDARQANFSRASLRGAYMGECILQEGQLEESDLENAFLLNVDLKSANLYKANLQYAELVQGNLYQAILTQANLQQADLYEANFQGAYMRHANLRYAKNVETAKFDLDTVLPDAEPLIGDEGLVKDEKGIPRFDKYWTPETDMRRYTDPNHYDFWLPPYLVPDYEGYKPNWVKNLWGHSE